MLKYIINKNKELISDTKDLVVQTSKNVDEIRVVISNELELGYGITPTITFENPKKVKSDEYIMEYDEANNEIYFLLNNAWFTSVEGIMNFTIRIYDTPSWENANDTNRVLATTKGSFRVETAINRGATPEMPETDLEQIYSAISQKPNLIDVQQEIETRYANNNPLKRLETTTKVSTLESTNVVAVWNDGTKQDISIPLPVDKLYSKEQIDTLNTNTNARIDNVVTKTNELSNEIESTNANFNGVVRYGDIEETQVPLLEINSARYDASGKEIHTTYATKTELQNYVTTNTTQSIAEYKVFDNGIGANEISSARYGNTMIRQNTENHNIIVGDNTTPLRLTTNEPRPKVAVNSSDPLVESSYVDLALKSDIPTFELVGTTLNINFD